MTLSAYRTLGRSGLVISPLTLGTMTFGTQRWGSGEDVSRAVFDTYVEAGGNSVDTADIYSGGRSEEMVGGFIADRKLGDRIVLATKSGFNSEAGNPGAGGNGAKNIRASVEASLRRLRTDYIDLYWVHVWDTVTPAEELLQTLGNLVRSGKILHFGLSNAPAWFIARMATLAQAHGVPGPIALQLHYSLTDRDIENEHLPAARELGLGVLPWSPLSGGFLAGKYQREVVEAQMRNAGPELPNSACDGEVGPSDDAGRLSGANPFGDMKFTDRNWAILDALRAVAAEVGKPPAQVALAWASGQPGITSPIVGASRLEQLTDNFLSLDVVLTAEQRQSLSAPSTPVSIYPYPIFSPMVNRMVFGGQTVRGW